MPTTTTPAEAGAAKSVATKLLIKPGTRLWISDDRMLPVLGSLPDGVTTVPAPARAATALLFARDAASLRSLLGLHKPALVHPSVLWVAYPKTNRIDLNRDTVWPILVEHGCRPIGQASIGDDWSAMRFRPLAEGEAAFTGGR